MQYFGFLYIFLLLLQLNYNIIIQYLTFIQYNYIYTPSLLLCNFIVEKVNINPRKCCTIGILRQLNCPSLISSADHIDTKTVSTKIIQSKLTTFLARPSVIAITTKSSALQFLPFPYYKYVEPLIVSIVFTVGGWTTIFLLPPLDYKCQQLDERFPVH